MKCPKCGKKTAVIDSRPLEDGIKVRRRRKCLKCDYRMSTQEGQVIPMRDLRIYIDNAINESALELKVKLKSLIKG